MHQKFNLIFIFHLIFQYIVFGDNSSSTTDDTDNDSDEFDVHRPVSPCNLIVIGANVDVGKSSLRSKSKTKKVRITLIVFLILKF